ncbi:MAG: 6-carboxytetrahydropterin synthase QueD [Gammaproteobacteria bacterium]|nr:6-carboxytetrahydropterin synthase QueD [Gammaproteobacteria bacterium]
MPSCYTLKIITDFAAAHLLRNYPGVCNRLHGHNWKIEVQVTASQLDDVGMGIDFKDMKAATMAVIDTLDHRNLNDLEPFTKINPTAENIAAYLYREISGTLNREHARVSAVTVWETERACVTYSEE